MLFDTDVLIWAQHGKETAVSLISSEEFRRLSVQGYMELMQAAKNRAQQDTIRKFLREFDFLLLPFTEKIGHRACVYVEQFSLSHGVRCGDAIIAATATENEETLCSANEKHFACIPDLRLKVFRP
jgi:predicted nucleic acid-binding protein